ncbi:MAG: glycoside hydrolase family 31 protein [Myxococcaceae bacterium]
MRKLLPLLALTCAACPKPVDPPPPPLALTGPTFTARLDGTSLVFSRDATTLLTLPMDSFQLGTVPSLDDNLSYDPYWLLVNDGVFTPSQPMGFAWRVPTDAVPSRDGDALVLTLTYNKNLSATVRATVDPRGHLTLRFVPQGTSTVAVMRVQVHADATEGFYGLGEWFDGINHRGKLRPMQLEPDLNAESANTENHVTTPLLIGSRGWAVFFETRRHGVLDVAKTEASTIDALFGTAESSSDGLTFHLFSAAEPLDLVAQSFVITGTPRTPAEWATGPWIWRNENRDQAEVEDDVKQLRDLDLATSAIWIDRPYATEVNTFDFNATQFPDAGAMISTIHAAGLRLALWHTPYLATGAAPFYAQATQQNYFPPGQGAWLNRWGPPLDTTNPDAVTFWRGLVRRYVDQGIEGFKLDFAEDVAAGVSGRRSMWRFADGSTDRTMADGYPRQYHQLYRAELGSNDGFLLVRHAQWGEASAGVIVWPGDIDATLTRAGEKFTDRGGKEVIGVGGLPAAIRAGVGLAASGFPFFASDTGGYRNSPPDKETFVRWVEHSALMPVMQTGDSSSQPPWLFTPENGRDAEALEVYRTFARLHLRLFPFFWSHVKRPETKPCVRAFGLQFPALGRHPEDEYGLGDELLVAPVATRGATTRTLIKPPGRWFDFDDGSELVGVDGAEVTVAAPLTKLPLFIAEGALVPMLEPTMDTLSPTTDPQVHSFANDPGTLWVRVQPAARETSFAVFDGTQLRQSDHALQGKAGTRFTGAVVWELRGVAVGAVTHAGAAVQVVADEAALAAVVSGVVHVGQRTLIKTPLDDQPTSWSP